jgi:hypothetical protein
MGIIQVLTGILHGKPGKDGMWDFAGKRSAVRARVALEKVRNEGTQELIRLLPPGTVLTEGGPGWFREIHMSETLPPGMAVGTTVLRSAIARLPADGLEPPPSATYPRGEHRGVPKPELAKSCEDDQGQRQPRLIDLLRRGVLRPFVMTSRRTRRGITVAGAHN